MNFSARVFCKKINEFFFPNITLPPSPNATRTPMLTDNTMRTALASFIQTHTALPLATGPIRFVNEGIFATIERMRTVMPMTEHGKYPNAATLELRGEWVYPRMMMNDSQAIEPDPPVIIVRDASGGVVVRLKPKSLEEIETMLARDVFDLENVQARIDEGKRAAEHRKMEAENETLRAQKRAELDAELRAAVAAVVDEFGAEIDALSRRIAARMEAQTSRVLAGVDERWMAATLDAFVDGEGRAAVARAVEERWRGAKGGGRA